MKCPHCAKTFDVPPQAVRNAECYGGSQSHVKCSRCGGAVLIRTRVTVAVDILGVGDNDKVECW